MLKVVLFNINCELRWLTIRVRINKELIQFIIDNNFYGAYGILGCVYGQNYPPNCLNIKLKNIYSS